MAKRTKNYAWFKLSKNRGLSELHIKELMRIFEREPYRESQPIIVNSDGTIRDGQHRFCALRNLELDIVYEIDDTIDADTCIAMNTSQRRWTRFDVVAVKADAGDTRFADLINLSDRYNRTFSLNAILGICRDSLTANRKELASIESYTPKLSIAEVQSRADAVFNFLNCVGWKKTFVGRKDVFIPLMAWLLSRPEVNYRHIVTAFSRPHAEPYIMYRLSDAIGVIESVYNKGLSKEKKIFVRALRANYEIERDKETWE